jgi:regulator of RNase E activity RraA
VTRFAPLNLTAEEVATFTAHWSGPRYADGRPCVPDEVIERLARLSITDVWAVLGEHGYRHQYEGGWQRIHADHGLCGRALTAMFMPRRNDVNEIVAQRAAAAGQIGEFTSWPIYALQPGDVYVADVFGRIEGGPIIGDNLATAIYARTGRGIVVHGAVRDAEGIARIRGFATFARGFHPTHALLTGALAGINCPVRIGAVSVMPGDVILAQGDGVLVIPPHVAEPVAARCEVIAIRDEFAKERLRERVYLSGEIDRKWSAQVEADFRRWLDNYTGPLPVAKLDFIERLNEEFP